MHSDSGHPTATWKWYKAIVTVIVFHVTPVLSAEEQDAKAKIIAATMSAREAVTSIKGEAVFRRWDSYERLTRHARLSIEAIGNNFRMDIHYQKVEHPVGFLFDRVVLISDGRSLYANSFSDRIMPTGCEIKVRDKSYSTFSVAAGGLGLNPASLSENMLGDLSSIKGIVHSAGNTDEGHHLLRYELTEHVEVELEVAPEYGFNVVRAEARGTEEPGNSMTYSATWAKSSGIWYIKKLVRKRVRDGKDASHMELKFTSFKPNVSIPPERFTMAALDPCERVRVFDVRPEDGANIYQYNAGINEKGLDGIAAQVKALPARLPPPQGPLRADPDSQSMLPWLIGFNVGLLVILGLFVGYRRYKAHHSKL